VNTDVGNFFARRNGHIFITGNSGFPKGPKLETWLDGEDAEKWGDWRGMLKPATEYAVMARSPLGESSATRNQVEHGTGNLNVEKCRIGSGEGGTREGEETKDKRYTNDGSTNFAAQPGPRGGDEDGRYPPNVALDPVMAEVMDLMSGERKGGNAGGAYAHDDGELYGEQRVGGAVDETSYNDSGGASRFFYCSKAPKSERTHGGEVDNDHETVKPIDLMEWLVKMVTAEGQTVLDPFAGSGTTLLAADNVDRHAVGIEREAEYVEIAESRWDAHTSE